MAYVDGFVIPVPRSKVNQYLKIARRAGKVWKKLGALEYRECAGDDLRPKGMAPFGRAVGLKPGETAFFSWIVYRSRKHRDQVNKKVMKDPWIVKMMQPGAMPFDGRRMRYGGFKVKVDL